MIEVISRSFFNLKVYNHEMVNSGALGDSWCGM